MRSWRRGSACDSSPQGQGFESLTSHSENERMILTLLPRKCYVDRICWLKAFGLCHGLGTRWNGRSEFVNLFEFELYTIYNYNYHCNV
eukprot:Pgem_evm1s15080